MKRTDKERLDAIIAGAGKTAQFSLGQKAVWYSEYHSLWYHTDGKGVGFKSPRDAIDAAMSASEAEEIEEAWKWFRESGGTLTMPTRCEKKWKVYDRNGVAVGGDHALHSTRDVAVLSAYHASKGK